MSDEQHTPDTPQKQCSKCKGLLPATPEYFFRRADRPGGLMYECKACHAAYQANERAHAPDNIKATRIAYNKAYLKKYYKTHREERIKASRNRILEHPEERRVYLQAYYLTHRDVLRDNTKRRHARKKGAPINDLTHAQWLEIQAAQDYRCAHCQKRCKGRLTQDHITPLSQGGSHTLHNVIGVCRSCNSKKGTKASPILVQPLLLTVA